MTGRLHGRGRRLMPVARARLRAAAAVTAGLVLLAVAGLGWYEPPVTSFGEPQAARLRDAGGGAAAPEPAAGPPEVAVSPGEPPGPVRTEPPVGLRIGAIDLDATVVETGVDPATDALRVPPPDQAGWYRHGPDLASNTGSMVIAGHVDGPDGPGVFWRIRELAAGDQIVLTGPDGHDHRFRVVAREVHHKQDLPDGIFARDGAARLTLITCGGPVDAIRGDYRDNIVITALPE